MNKKKNHRTDSIPPKKRKMFILIWVIVYPLILIVTNTLRLFFPEMNSPLSMLITSLTIVSAMVFIMIPLINKFLGKWIRK